MLPMFAFCLVAFLGSFVRVPPAAGWISRFLESFLVVANFVVPFATFYFVARWRQKHRLIRASLLAVEVLLGLFLAGVVFLATTFFWGMANLD
jgi:hypothetical protein